MTMNDETLSAFLDGELPEAEMQRVRARLAEEPELAERLAQLSAADATLRGHYGAIDERPLPEGVQRLLQGEQPEPESTTQAEPEQSSAEVIEFPFWRRARQSLSQHAGLAASVALALGFALAHMTGGLTEDDGAQWRTVASGLESLPSGANQTLDDGRTLTPRLSFVSRDGQYCRQYRIAGETENLESIACRQDDSPAGWQQVASVRQPAVQPGSYQTASGGSVLDSALDRMMRDGVIEPGREKTLIEQNWQNQPNDS